MKKPPPVSYTAEFTPLSGKVIDGSMRRIAKVTLYRFDKPEADGKKCGTETVRAWTWIGLRHEYHQAKDRLVRADQAKRAKDKIDKRERIKQAYGID